MKAMFCVVLLSTVLAAAPCQAQLAPSAVIDPLNGVSLEGAIAEGLRAEPAMRAARLDVDAARGERRQAALRPNPDVSFGQREQVGGADRQTSLEFDLPLDTFRRGARIETAARMVDTAEAAVLDRERLLAAAIRQHYGAVLVAARRLEIADLVLDAGRRTYELLRARAAEGAAPPLDRDVALVELRKLEGERERAAGEVAGALAGLRPLLGRPASAVLTLSAPLEAVVRTQVPPTVSALVERPDVRQAAAQVAVARARARAAAQDGKPEFRVFGGYTRMAQGFPQDGLGPSGEMVPIAGVFHNLGAGLRVSIPLWNRGQGARAAADARERAAAHLLTARQLAAGSEVAAATARVEAARRGMAAYSEETRLLAQRNLEVIRETYTLGRVTLFEVLNEQRRFLEFETAVTETLAELFSAQTALLRATGERQ